MNGTKSAALAGWMAALAIPGLALQAAAPIPIALPRPDGKPRDPAKPVKVYLLAGQSNMVGMGDLAGARPLYPSVFLSANPAIIPGAMPIGVHGVYHSADANAPKGAKAAVYQGAYDPKVDYVGQSPEKTATVALGTVKETLPTMDGP